MSPAQVGIGTTSLSLRQELGLPILSCDVLIPIQIQSPYRLRKFVEFRSLESKPPQQLVGEEGVHGCFSGALPDPAWTCPFSTLQGYNKN
ncbi:hypothetical protein DEO72_LG6g1795 [Vigna unguiculata]|uniref:Uncharacterized protein n=1 Tax=Vigna unguiculata TaxID=3917 RepID=A0A4D6M767_VIGUN|nr:hypothetical protein DEO72_LG6g1795 [Vigna unguiculata]